MRSVDLVASLRRHGVRDVDDSDLARALYASDASLYRVPPQVVARPQHVDELDAILAAAREVGVPVTMRGAGTSIAGNAIGPGIVVDTRRHLHRVLELDPEARTAVVEPGAVHATLQRAATAQGLRFGPDPSTHTRCTVGGMVGNNACGSRALGYGRTVDNVVALDAVTSGGEPVQRLAERLDTLVGANLGLIRTELGRFSRQVSGYSLEHLLPERGRSLDRFLVGSEGTLAVVRRATVRLVEDAPVRVLVVLGYPSMAEAADAVPALLGHGPVACEGLDERITAMVPDAPPLPAGRGWLFVELTGATEGEVVARVPPLVADAGASGHRVVTDLAEQLALWRIREDGAGLAARTTRPPGQAGWEDAAVPPDRLGAYLRDFDRLLVQHRLHGVPYGHFGDGCVHVRIDFDLARSDGRAGYRSFVEDAARLVASYGGSLSGEHGDGRARSELLPVMYGADVVALFAQVKRLLDPAGLLNPGVLVDPAPVDADLRLEGLPTGRPVAELGLPRDADDFLEAVHRCTGVGKCLADTTGIGGVMCPSYQATGEEKDSTRGRARVLQDAVSGRLPGGWDSPALADALDLCLGCKGCARDCPTGVDVATYKVEALHRRYAGRRRPLTHYTLGRLPRLLALTPPRVAAAGLRLAPRLAARLAGVDPRRSLPTPVPEPFSARPEAVPPDEPDVVLWVDTFTNRFTPEVADAALRVLEHAGARVRVVAQADLCCGLTWLSTGQLDRARSVLDGLVQALEQAGDLPVVVLEPSCLALLRHDAEGLLGARGRSVGERARSLSEHLTVLDWTPPDLAGTTVLAQPHCHQAAVVGWQADRDLLARAGVEVTAVGGCCGLAGDFGMTRGHYEVSVAVFEHDLGPAVRTAPAGTVLLTDGFSCRTQVADLAGIAALHLAQLWAQNLPNQERSDA